MEMEKTDHLCGVNDDRKSVCDKEEKIGQLLSELLESERSYVQDLNQVISSPQYSDNNNVLSRYILCNKVNISVSQKYKIFYFGNL